MVRALFLALLALMLFCTSPSGALAQSGQRAYAPENLSQLSVPERIRVIENEYFEQSGGRRIADDQLEFYLDQIQYSRWTFSRIRQDMATSLQGSSRPGWGGWRPPSAGWNQRSLICSSVDRRYQECRAPWRGRARLVDQISNTRCIEGQNWGSRNGTVWVNQGCRGRFAPDVGAGDAEGLRCESVDGRYTECRAGYRGEARLLRQLSNNACIEGRTWGQRGEMIWVDRGCRGIFSVGGYGDDDDWNDDYSVSCSSDNGGYNTCSWSDRYGRPRLLQQLSNSACIEGRTWGYSAGRIWVDRGCRALFGPR